MSVSARVSGSSSVAAVVAEAVHYLRIEEIFTGAHDSFREI